MLPLLAVLACFTVGTVTPSSTVGGVPPVTPPWPSPLPAFGSSWFGGSLTAFEWENPAELAKLRKYKMVLTGWMELLTVNNYTNASVSKAPGRSSIQHF